LIVYGAESVKLPDPRPDLRVHRIGRDGAFRDPDDGFAMTYGLGDGDLLLVRPDGYVGAIGSAIDHMLIARYLEAWLP